ncbi:hypothetical protein ABBQ38_004049 [Trebouxia sp. C0009 RCD-2024]
MEPASASGAEALAEVVTAALRMQYEPVEDEISLADGVPPVLCLRWLEIPDVCHATRDIRSFQVSSATIPCHIGGQAADCLDCSAEFLDHESTG